MKAKKDQFPEFIADVAKVMKRHGVQDMLCMFGMNGELRNTYIPLSDSGENGLYCRLSDGINDWLQHVGYRPSHSIKKKIMQAKIFVYRWQGEPWNSVTADPSYTEEFEDETDLREHCIALICSVPKISAIDAFSIDGNRLLVDVKKSRKQGPENGLQVSIVS